MQRTLRVLLIQVRDAEDPMREHELECFATRTRLARSAFGVWDAVGRSPTLSEVRGYDALMVGGSGDYNVSKRNQPGLDHLLELLREVSAVGHPTFASCYGFQCLVAAHGGEIVHDESRTEVGTYEMELTDAGRADPVLGSLPARFQAQQGHKDHADRLPDGFENLARSERSPLQALRVPGEPVWGVQFHPELDHLANRRRYEHYLDAYSAGMSVDERARALSRFRPSPHASELLQAFLALV